jgi:hypothetical protein
MAIPYYPRPGRSLEVGAMCDASIAWLIAAFTVGAMAGSVAGCAAQLAEDVVRPRGVLPN